MIISKLGIFWWIIGLILILVPLKYIKNKNFIHNTPYLPSNGIDQYYTFLLLITAMLSCFKPLIKKSIIKDYNNEDEIGVIRGITIKNRDFTSMKGTNWIDEKHKEVFLSYYNILHFFIYMLGVFLAPDLFWGWIYIGLWWEILESFNYIEVWDFMDLPSNILGIFCGYYLRKYIDNKFKIKNKKSSIYVFIGIGIAIFLIILFPNLHSHSNSRGKYKINEEINKEILQF